MEEFAIVIMIAIISGISAIVKKAKQPDSKKPSQSGSARPVSRQTDAVLRVQRMEKEQPAAPQPGAKAAAPAMVTPQVFPGMPVQPGTVPAAIPLPPKGVPAQKTEAKGAAPTPDRKVKLAAAHTPLPHPESPPNTQGGEGHEGPGEHPCLQYEDTPIARPQRIQVSPREMRQAVIMKEILDKPMSLRRGWARR